MKVVSLFDGISCARVALDRLGHKRVEYLASEIDEAATRISSRNWPDIVALGDVKNVDGKKIRRGGSVDLLIGGSPCQDLSIAKKGRQGLKGSRSSLFYEYLRILKEIKPRYFVLENVASMSQESKDIISAEIGVKPILIDAALVSAQSRKRLFWTNIPGVCQPWDRGIVLKDILESGFVDRDKSYAIVASYGKKNARDYFLRRSGQMVYVKEATIKGFAIARDGDSIDISFPTSKTRRGRVGQKVKNIMTSPSIAVFTKGVIRKLTPIECERAFSLPDRYTEGESDAARYHALGNAFNVEVIAHILKHADL